MIFKGASTTSDAVLHAIVISIGNEIFPNGVALKKKKKRKNSENEKKRKIIKSAADCEKGKYERKHGLG